MCWILSRVTIIGNDKADVVAKHVENMEIELNFKILHTDLKSQINRFIKQKWQRLSNNAPITTNQASTW